MAAAPVEPLGAPGFPSGERPPPGPTWEDDLEAAAALLRRVAQGLREDRTRQEALAGGFLPRAHPPQGITGADLRRAREAERLSQRELGQLLSVSRGLIADAELQRRRCPPLVEAWAKRILQGGG